MLYDSYSYLLVGQTVILHTQALWDQGDYSESKNNLHLSYFSIEWKSSEENSEKVLRENIPTDV